MLRHSVGYIRLQQNLSRKAEYLLGVLVMEHAVGIRLFTRPAELRQVRVQMLDLVVGEREVLAPVHFCVIRPGEAARQAS